ncbi:MAG: NAD-dependent epimerase/dehydratase family protein [Candidatus Dormibacterales bacterium]
MTSAGPDRVLITGVSNPLGAEVARRLAPHVPHLFGCDVSDPVSALEDMDFVHADTRHAAIGKLIRQLRIDTIVHLAVIVDGPKDDRTIHETNVIGTMNVLIGAAPPSSPVRRLVVKSSQAVYGAGPKDPSFFSEEMSIGDRPSTAVARDLAEMEQLVGEFALRNEPSRVTTLRLGFRLSEETSLARYLSLPVVPAFAGFDPRLQFLHEDDAADVIVRSVLGDHPGVFNVAGEGIVLLSQAIDAMGGRSVPVLVPYARLLARLALRTLARVELPAHIVDVISYGSVMDCARLGTEFGWAPVHSSRDVIHALVRGREAEVIDAPSPPQEYELQVYLQRRRRAAQTAVNAGTDR